MKECLRTPYATQREARQKIGKIRRGRARDKGHKPSTRVYEEKKCDICPMWHITSRNGKG